MTKFISHLIEIEQETSVLLVNKCELYYSYMDVTKNVHQFNHFRN